LKAASSQSTASKQKFVAFHILGLTCQRPRVRTYVACVYW